MAYGFVGLGKFMQIFIPWPAVSHYIPFHVSPAYVPDLYGIVFTLFAVFYAILGGMHSIVLGDVIKYVDHDDRLYQRGRHCDGPFAPAGSLAFRSPKAGSILSSDGGSVLIGMAS